MTDVGEPGFGVREGTSLAPYFIQLAARPSWRWSGRVVEANGQTVESE
jgi:flagellum-specific ATP synthase